MNNNSFTFEPELNDNIIDMRGKRVIRYFSYTNLWIAFVVIVNEENAGDASQVIDKAMDEFWETDDICYGDLVEEKLRAANIEYIIIYHDPYLESEEYEDAWENYVASLTSEEYMKNKNEIENAIIKSADLSMADHGSLTLCLHIEGNGWACMLGGYCLGHGYLGAKEFNGSPKGIEEIMRIMDVIGVDSFSKLAGKHIRVEKPEWGGVIKKFGHIINDKWFDYNEFYKE